MPDSIFFPLAALLAAGFVYIAAQPYADRAPTGPISAGGQISAEDITVSGDQLHRFLPGTIGGLTLEGNDDTTTIRFNRMAEPSYDDPRTGAHIVLAEDIEFAFEDRPIEITVEARSTGNLAAEQFQINYLARPGSESGWQTFHLTRDFQTHTFSWAPPRRGETLGHDFLGFRPVVPEKRRTMEIKSIRLRATGPKSSTVPKN